MINKCYYVTMLLWLTWANEWYCRALCSHPVSALAKNWTRGAASRHTTPKSATQGLHPYNCTSTATSTSSTALQMKWLRSSSQSTLVLINTVALHLARLLLGCVTVCWQVNHLSMFTGQKLLKHGLWQVRWPSCRSSRGGKVLGHLGQLSLPSFWGR